MKFLGEFWDYEKSPYIREVHLRGKSYTKIENQRICMIGSGHKTDRVFADYVIWHCECGRMSYGECEEFVVEW